jgi:hypothetical protein
MWQGLKTIHSNFIIYMLAILAILMHNSFASELNDKEKIFETKIKLAFIYKFIEYIDGDWEFATNDNIIVISVFGVFSDDELVFLEQSGLNVIKKIPMKIKYNPNVTDVKDSDILFFTKGSESKIDEIFKNARQNILSIGDIKYFIDKGGVIELSEYRGKLRFKIDNQLAKKRGIMFSAKLLELSER